jgi:hypothetical protein
MDNVVPLQMLDSQKSGLRNVFQPAIAQSVEIDIAIVLDFHWRILSLLVLFFVF